MEKKVQGVRRIKRIGRRKSKAKREIERKRGRTKRMIKIRMLEHLSLWIMEILMETLTNFKILSKEIRSLKNRNRKKKDKFIIII